MKTAIAAVLLLAALPTFGSNANADRRMANAQERLTRQQVFNAQMAARYRALVAEQEYCRRNPRNSLTRTGFIQQNIQRRENAIRQFWNR